MQPPSAPPRGGQAATAAPEKEDRKEEELQRSGGGKVGYQKEMGKERKGGGGGGASDDKLLECVRNSRLDLKLRVAYRHIFPESFIFSFLSPHCTLSCAARCKFIWCSRETAEEGKREEEEEGKVNKSLWRQLFPPSLSCLLGALSARLYFLFVYVLKLLSFPPRASSASGPVSPFGIRFHIRRTSKLIGTPPRRAVLIRFSHK